MVLPQRPAGTEALTEDELAELITRDALIGVTTVSGHELTAHGSVRLYCQPTH
jgi:hypothetical protein